MISVQRPQRRVPVAVACCILFFALLALLPTAHCSLPTAQAAPRGEEPLAVQVREAIKRGVQFLRAQEKGHGDWQVDAESVSRPGGWTSLAMLALLNAGVPVNDPTIQRGLENLRNIPPNQTYVVGLQTMVFALAGQPEDMGRIKANAKWLIDARVMNGNQLLGWTYTANTRGQRPDNSNAQYALLGLHEAHRAGVEIDREVWKSIQDFYIRTQQLEGTWGYPGGMDGARMTMTTAGLCGLLISGMDLNKGRETPRGDGTWNECGQYKENRPVAKALEWIGQRLPANRIGSLPNLYYSLYGLERAGRLSGQRFLGEHDWYRVGCEFLVKNQQPDGSWKGIGIDGLPVLATSFSLLFLSKGRTPVLISKIAHGPRETESADWNNDRNDARNLVEFASRELFKKQPLAWQVFDASRRPKEGPDAIRELAGDLLESPIIYFNGHREPRFTGQEEELLKEYIANGGFILAEACCGRKEFHDGFVRLMIRLFPDAPLQKLPPEHPIWSSKFPFEKPPTELWGIQQGCKTVVVYSPNDLSCWWEANEYDKGQGRVAFQVGANIIAYATGMELPRDRGFHVEVAKDDAVGKPIRRGFLEVAQLKHAGDWQPAPRAMRNLMSELRTAGLDVVLKPQDMNVNNAAIADYRFFYMHGRSAFSFQDADLKTLQFNLKTGGLLLADACCGSKNFDNSFRTLIGQLFPGQKLEPIPLTDELFSQELNGTAITKVRCRRLGADGKTPDAEFRTVDPELEGVKVNGRWAVIYSKYDIGCALEATTGTDCLGHDHASAVQLGKAAVLYAYRR